MPVSIHAGQLRERVTWYKPVRTRFVGGQKETEYELAGPTVAKSSMWANVRPAGGTEQDTHDQPVMIRSHIVTVRDKPHAVAADWRCVWRGRTLDCVAVNPADTNDGAWLVIDCLELTPATT